jgi:phosphoglucomutase
MAISPLAGKPAPKEMLVDLAKLEGEYYERKPDMGDPNEVVAFGTSGHRGSSFRGSFNEAHILAITHAICDYRRGQDTHGPLYMGKDTHALSGPAQRTALEVLVANDVHRKDAYVRADMLDVFARWIDMVLKSPARSLEEVQISGPR